MIRFCAIRTRAYIVGPCKPYIPAAQSLQAILYGEREKSMKTKRTSYVAHAGLIAALYCAATLITALFLQGLAWGPVQLRVSEALVVLAILTPAAVPGLTIGCVIANLMISVINGTGALGLFDVVFGSLATLLGALWCSRFRERPALALAGPVVANALIVPAYLPLLLQGLGFYTIPFTSLSLDGAYVFMYVFGVISIAIGEALVVFVLGLPLLKSLQKVKLFKPALFQ